MLKYGDVERRLIPPDARLIGIRPATETYGYIVDFEHSAFTPVNEYDCILLHIMELIPKNGIVKEPPR